MAILAGISLIVAAETPPKNKIAKQTLAKSASVRRSYSLVQKRLIARLSDGP